MNKSTKKIMIAYSLILVATLLSESILANAIAATFTISPGVYPDAPDYTFWMESGICYCKNAYGSLIYSGSNASAVIDAALSTLVYTTHTEKYKIALIGTFTMTGAIRLGNRTTMDLTDARLVIDDNYDSYIITNRNPSHGAVAEDNNIVIIGGKIDGNKANNAAEGPIYFCNVSELGIRDTFVWKGKDYNIKLLNVHRGQFSIIAMDSDGDGVQINNCAQIVGDIQSFGNYVGVRMIGSEEILLRGAIYITESDGLLVTGSARNSILELSISYADGNGASLTEAIGLTLKGAISYSQLHGLRIEGSNYTTVEGEYFRSNGLAAPDTYDDVFITDYDSATSYYNRLSIIADSTNVLWNVEEGGSSDWNLIFNTMTFHASGIKMAVAAGSSNSRITGSYNGTVWIEHWGSG